MARPGVRVIAASSFTAGALARISPAVVLPPGLSRGWFNTLFDASAVSHDHATGPRLVTAFRLEDWRSKGLPELVEALKSIGRDNLQLTVCGTGQASSELKLLVSENPYCVLKVGLTDSQLAKEFAMADLFVLATRTSSRGNASGEGFGLVLLEAQIAGTPVVAPAYGGSHDAYLHGLTGSAPADETAGALAQVIDDLLGDPWRLARMGSNAAAWAQESFDPDRYAALAAEQLL